MRLRKLPNEIGEMDADIREMLEQAGLVVGRRLERTLLTIERDKHCIYWDVGPECRLVGDIVLDRSGDLFREVASLLHSYGVIGGPLEKKYRRVERHRRARSVQEF